MPTYSTLNEQSASKLWLLYTLCAAFINVRPIYFIS